MTITNPLELAQAERVTPAMAERWLNAHNNANRSLREGIVERYAQDMLAGKWSNCIDPIAFYDDGELADGQHRLYAICESQTVQTFIIVRGLSRADGLNIDTGITRNIVDNAKISGEDTELSHELLATCRAVHFGDSRAPEGFDSIAARLKVVEVHREAAAWAVHNGPRGRHLRNAATLAAVARAYPYHPHDLERLHRFGEVVTSGMSTESSEFAAVTLRNYLIQNAGHCLLRATWRETFLKAQNALAYFMRGKPLTHIKGVKDEAYPIHKSMEAAAAAVAPLRKPAPKRRAKAA